MNRERFYLDGKAVWLYTFKCVDDQSYNMGFDENDGSFVGTEKAFKDFRKEMASAFGWGCWDIKKTHCDKADYEEMLSYLD